MFMRKLSLSTSSKYSHIEQITVFLHLTAQTPNKRTTPPPPFSEKKILSFRTCSLTEVYGSSSDKVYNELLNRGKMSIRLKSY